MRMEMKIKKYLHRDWLWVKPHGDLDLATADQFRDALHRALETSGCRRLWLDFSQVNFIDSSGLGVILGRYRELQPLGGGIMITKPKDQVYRLLMAAGLHRVMEIDRPLDIKFSEEGI